MGCLSMDRIGKLYTSQHEARNSNLPLIHRFLGKFVKVKVDVDCEVSGVLICYQMENKANHKPSVLVLKNGGCHHFLRGTFISISEAK